MKNEVLFRETQKFTQWWLWALLILTGIVAALRLSNGSGQTIKEILPALSPLLIVVLIYVVFAISTLETEISVDGIHVRFRPFHRSFRIYPWRSLRKADVRRYSPLLEYGGWGIRGFGSNRAWNVSGSYGIQIQTKRGKKLLIGTQKPELAREVIDHFFKSEQP